MIVPAPVTVFFQREKQRSTVPPVHITDRPGGNIHAVIITGRSGAAESEEVRRVGNEALTGRAESRIGKSRADIQPDRKYLQMIKERDDKGRFLGIRLKAVYGDPEELIQLLGRSTAYVERTHLTMRTFSSRLTRKSIAFSKEICIHKAVPRQKTCIIT